jgi:hypothetical protein
MVFALLVLPGEGHILVRCLDRAGGGRLTAVGFPEAGRFPTAWETSVPSDTLFLWDAARTHGLIVWSTDTGPCWCKAGAEPPDLPPQDRLLSYWEIGQVVHLFCGPHTGPAVGPAVRAAINAILALPAGSGEARCREFEARFGQDPDALAALVGALRDGWNHPRHPWLLAQARRRHPTHPLLALWGAHDLADKGFWEQAAQILAEGDGAGLDPKGRAHRYHLLGLARLFLDDLPGGRAALEAAAGVEGGRCPVDDALAWCAALEHPDGLPPPTGNQARLVLLVRLLRGADRCLDAGDLRGAISALDHGDLWRRVELQCAARRAWAWLQVEPQSDGERLAKLIALGTLVDRVIRSAFHISLNLPLPPRTWSYDRIMEVGYAAHEWLESADFGT